MPNVISPSASKLKLLFFGSDRFSLATLERLASQVCVDVVTKSNTAIDRWAKDKGIRTRYWSIGHGSPPRPGYTIDNPLSVNNGEYDLGMVVSFGHLIDETTIKSFSTGIFNIHPSLLPRWRGSSPIQKAILAGDTHTGISLMRVVPHRFDVGEVIIQHRVPIFPRETAINLYDRLAILGADISERFLFDIEGHLRNAWQQESKEDMKTYAKKLKPEDGYLNFVENNCWHIDRRFRAYAGFLDVYTSWLDGKKLRLYDMQDPHDTQEMMTIRSSRFDPIRVVADHRIFYHKKKRLLCFMCADQTWVAFASLATHGRRQMSALDFFNGFLSKLPSVRIG